MHSGYDEAICETKMSMIKIIMLMANTPEIPPFDIVLTTIVPRPTIHLNLE